MKNFKKGGFNRGGDFGGRPKFENDRGFGARGGDRDNDRRGGDRERSGRPELFSAICSNCGKPCELPFRPNGDRPVFCRDCFDKKDDARGHSTFQRTERPREFRSPSRENGSHDSSELKKQIANLEFKMDKMLKMLEHNAQSHKHTPVEVMKEVSLPEKLTPPNKTSVVKAKTEVVTKKVVAKKGKSAPVKKVTKKK